MPSPDDRVWSLVLAGGEGERVRPLVERWLGRHVPKQYCTFVGTRSMLQHTLDRAERLTPAGQIVTVIARSHRDFARPRHGTRTSGMLVPQPANRDTAPGIFLALSYVRAFDPGATVAVFPSDHFIHPEERFLQAVKSAVALARQRRTLVLLGIQPDRLELEYGWITPGADLGMSGAFRARALAEFIEKPTSDCARAAWKHGGLWNTMVMAAPADALWRMGWMFVPEVMVEFERLVEAIGTTREADVLDRIYETLPRANFSSQVLQRAGRMVAVLEVAGVRWSDWGDPRRIEQTIRELGKTPTFNLPLELVS